MRKKQTKLLFAAAAFLPLGLLSSQPASAQNGNYLIRYDKATRNATVTSSCCGTYVASPQGFWGVLELISTPPGVKKPAGKTKHVAEFEFYSNGGYFDADNLAHVVLFLRGDKHTVTVNPNYPYRGHGLVFGYVAGPWSQTHVNGYACSRTTKSNPVTTVIEVAGAVAKDGGGFDDNCVFATEMMGVPLRNAPDRYKAKLTSEYAHGKYTTRYTLHKCRSMTGSACSRWEVIVNDKQITYRYPQLPSTLGGWFFAAVPDTNKSWTLNIDHLNVRWE